MWFVVWKRRMEILNRQGCCFLHSFLFLYLLLKNKWWIWSKKNINLNTKDVWYLIYFSSLSYSDWILPCINRMIIKRCRKRNAMCEGKLWGTKTLTHNKNIKWMELKDEQFVHRFVPLSFCDYHKKKNKMHRLSHFSFFIDDYNQLIN